MKLKLINDCSICALLFHSMLANNWKIRYASLYGTCVPHGPLRGWCAGLWKLFPFKKSLGLGCPKILTIWCWKSSVCLGVSCDLEKFILLEQGNHWIEELHCTVVYVLCMVTTAISLALHCDHMLFLFLLLRNHLINLTLSIIWLHH